MDSRKFKVLTGPIEGLFTVDEVEAEDVVTHDGFVVFIDSDEENDTTVTVAMFNSNWVKSVMEVTKND